MKAIARAVAEMQGFPGPWGIAGGWALDLFLRRQTRPHADIDIAVLRADQQQLRARLSGHVQQVVSGRLVDWLPDQWLEVPVHEIHLTWPDGGHLEFLLNEHDAAANEWIFRRDPRVRRSLAQTFLNGPVAPYLAPELVLLYKAKSFSAKDDADFAAVRSHLDAERCAWLHQALLMTDPAHPWIAFVDKERDASLRSG